MSGGSVKEIWYCETYEGLLEKFTDRNEAGDVVKSGSEVFRGRIASLKTDLNKFITANVLSDCVRVYDDAINRVVLDYFSDIARLKDFHNIPLTNDDKIHAYTAFWLLRHKPLQVISVSPGLEFINEKFVSEYLGEYLLHGCNTLEPTDEQYKWFNDFVKMLNYTFKYRQFSVQSIELALLAFNAGVKQADKSAVENS